MASICLACGTQSLPDEEPAVARTTQALEAVELPFMKYLFNQPISGQPTRLYLRQAHVPTMPTLRGEFSAKQHEVANIDEFGTFIGDIHSQFPGRCSGGPCQNAVDYGGASGTSHNDSDWITWASVDEIFAKELRAFGAFSPTQAVHVATGPLTSVPVIASFQNELVVVWTEDFRLMMSKSADGASWSPGVALETAETAYGTHLALTPFQGKLYVAYVIGSTQIGLREVLPASATLGPQAIIRSTSGAIVGRAVSMAAYLDEYLSVAYAYQDSTSPYVEVLHTQSVGTWLGPFEISRYRQRTRPALAYGVAEVGGGRPELVGPNLYVVQLPDGPDFVTATAVQPVVQLLSNYDGLHYRLDDNGVNGRGPGTLFNSSYAFGGGEDNTLSIEVQPEACKHRIELSWAWAIQAPPGLIRHDVLLNGRALEAGSHNSFRSQAPEGSHTFDLEVIPDNDNVIQLAGILSDGTRVLSNEVTYRFTPCGTRNFSVAVVRSRIAGSPSTYVDGADLEQMFFGATDSVKSYLADVSGGTLVMTGTVFDRDDQPIDFDDTGCDPPVDGWYTSCPQSRPLVAARSAFATDGFDVRVDTIGGWDEAGVSGGTAGNQIDIDGRLLYEDVANTGLHEMGHYLGLMHEGVWGACTNGLKVGESIFNLNAGSCKAYNYGGFGVLGTYIDPNRLSLWPWPTPFPVLYGQMLGYLGADSTLYVTETGEFELTAADNAAPGDLLELRVPLANDVNTFYSFELHSQSTRLPSGDGVIVSLHPGGLLGQPDNFELALVALNIPSQPFVDPFRGIKSELVEYRAPNKALVRITIDPFASEFVTGTVSGGESITTDTEGDGATASDPVETEVVSPNAGPISIEEELFSGDPAGYAVFGQQVVISAPIASPEAPLQLTFRVDQSILPPVVDPAAVLVLRNGVPVGPCDNPGSTQAVPTPCVASAAFDSGDLVFTVFTARASTWSFALTEPSDAPCLLAESTLQIGDRSEAYSNQIYAGQQFTVGGDFAIAAGDVEVAGNAVLGANAVIDGNLAASGSITTNGPVLVTGETREQVQVVQRSIPTQFFESGTNDLIVENDSTAIWQPGNYRIGQVRARSVVMLGAGNYYFDSLQLEPDTQVLFDVASGDARIYVQGALVLGDRSQVLGGGDGEIVFYTNTSGTIRVGTDSVLEGSVQAPNGNLLVSSRTRIAGCLAGQNVTFEPDVVLVEKGRDVTGVPVPEPTCQDGVQNGDEQGVDCGGQCDVLCPLCQDQRIYEAEDMFHSTGGATPGGWNIWSNGYISAVHDFDGGPVSLTVSAKGQQAFGVWPHMVVRVGGSVVGSVNVTTSSWASYAFDVAAPAGPQEVRVTYDNDVNSPWGDRNLLVDNVAISCQ